MVTFNVDQVRRAKDPLKTANCATVLKRKGVEAQGANSDNLIAIKMNPFIGACHYAYDKHYGLTLSPDDVWLVIAQGFATHVNLNAEKLRDRFVKHEGQELIRVRRDEFVKGSPSNNWQGCFAEFSDQIRDRIGKQRDLIVSDFSTTGAVELAASEVILMGALKGYFKYEVYTRCGIPEINLLGTAADWKSVRDRARALGEYGLEPWVKKLVPVLDEFVEAAQGQPRTSFWHEFYKEHDGSGGTQITGHVHALFPYLRTPPYGDKPAEDKVNTYQMGGWGPTNDLFPPGVTTVPFVWDYLGARFDMNFTGGFVGVAQDRESLFVRPAIGWTVGDRA